ncbi:MAG: GNAT family protein [Alphaproteobacteria bacterium]|nr:GNAT family protein [Alphaproteobacteria bacterium]
MSRLFISGEGFYLRGVEADDLEAYGRWLDDSRVTEFLEMGSKPSRQSDRDAFWHTSQEADDAVVFMICDKASDRPVGTCGLYLIQWVCRRAQFNILIGEPDFWDKGFGRGATSALLEYGFRTLNLESIQLGVNAENARAIRAYENAGFIHEGRRRRFVYCNGQYNDVLLMSVLRDEYLSAA